MAKVGNFLGNIIDPMVADLYEPNELRAKRF